MENISKMFKKEIQKAGMEQSANSYSKTGDSGTANDIIKSTNIEKNKFSELPEEETKEATGAASSGGFEAPLFSEPKKNNLFQPDTETKLTTKPKGGYVSEEEEIEGGLGDNKTVEDIAKQHKVDVEQIEKQLKKGIKVEYEHTGDRKIAKEIALDHLVEFPDYYDRLERAESEPKKVESKEATTSSSVGAYDAPFGGGRKDPLQIDTPKSVYGKLRSVKDKKFPKLGGPGSTYVKVKDKCKKFPYCNQGDTNSLEFFKNKKVKSVINRISKNHNVNENYVISVILENVDIYNKNIVMSKNIENIIDKMVGKVLSEEIDNKIDAITESLLNEMVNTESKNFKPDFLDLDKDGDTEEPMKNAAETDEEVEEGNAFSGARAEAIKKGESKFTVDGVEYDVEGEEDEVNESKKYLKLTEEEMIDLIEKIVNEEKVEGIKDQNTAMKKSKTENEKSIKDTVKKLKDYLKLGSNGNYEEEPKHFPKGNGELEKMEKMAYTPSKGVEEYIDQIARSGGMENLEYDQIKPDEEWLDANIVGSSETGNSDEYANAVPTDVNKSVKKRKDDNILGKLKAQSYNKSPQPVTDFAGHKTNEEEFAGIEISESKKQNKINEDIDRIKNLFTHSYKSQ